jgi:YHS domain-containing protein
MKIFVSVASYKDRELVKTIKSLTENARKPQNLRIHVLDQNTRGKHPDLDFAYRIQHHKVDFREARGAGWARKKLMEKYDGETYFFQVDSHMRFAKNWDVRLMTMLDQTQESTGIEKIILSQFPAPYKLFTNGKEYYPKDDPYFWDQPSWTSVVNTWYGAWAGNREVMQDKTNPHKSHTILAGYVFSLGSLVEEVPYDERISFMGEELCFAVRAYTRGWEIYAPHEMLLWHFYSRKDHPKIWSPADNRIRDVSWEKMEELSKQVQKDILTGKETGVYGIGDRRRFGQYQRMIGINFKEFYKQKELGEQ